MVVHVDAFGGVIFWVTLLFGFALLGRFLSKSCQQPAVLGELLMGICLGNLGYLLGEPLFIILREGGAIFPVVGEFFNGLSLTQAVTAHISSPIYSQGLLEALKSPAGMEAVQISFILDAFARFGALFLLFQVGLESALEDLLRTGKAAFQVALIGVIAPIILGFIVIHWLLPESSYHTQLFVAVTLSATSIGITARVLKDLNILQSPEASTILGAATLDDILGLILLALLSALAFQGSLDWISLVFLLVKTVFFFAGAIVLGPIVIRWMVRAFYFVPLWENKLFVSFLFMMGLACLANAIGLAAIIGAFSAGLVLRELFFHPQSEDSLEENLSLIQAIAPFTALLAPFFFMLMGFQVKIESFLDFKVLLIALGLIVAAIVGKLCAGLGANSSDDRLLVGMGMLPRGEVGLLFASIGKATHLFSDAVFSAIVLMVIVTTMITPWLLKQRYSYKRKKIG